MDSGKPKPPIQFNLGTDRLYGLNDNREPVQDKLEEGVKGDLYDHSDVTIDRINNRLRISFPVGSYSPLQPPQSAHPTDKQFHEFLKKQEGVRGKSFNGRDKDSRIRRASKLGVDFTAQSGGKVHFVLGDLESSMADVVHKRNFRKDGGKDFTASELRYIYRNRERLKDSVQFYDKSLKPTAAPWVADPDLWANYKPGTGMQHSFPNVLQRSPIGSPSGSPLGSPQLSPMNSQPPSRDNSPPSTPTGIRRGAIDFSQLSNLLAPLASPVITPPVRKQSHEVRIEALDLAGSSGRKPWNSSTRIDRPLSDTAHQNTKRPKSSDFTGKIGSKHWPTK